eukprot:Seg3268.1 transcript_id=Seg3268.1/GoldUCD/mRNA.D3Y31 product=Hemicentin-1 protein_id=Seg3268.1/GoldUCD/D3Y31
MGPSTSDHRRFLILVATNGMVACALVCLTVYTVSMHSNVSKLTDSLRDMESKFQAFKMDDNTRTAATRQQLQKLSRELHKTRQRRSLDLWRMTGIPNRIFNGTMFVPVLLKGAPGPRGPPGKEGPQGHTGLKGKGGERGRRGKPGPMGLHGIKGEPGSIGMPGPRGAHGKVGAKGEKGDRGERGITGMKGESVAVPKITAPPSDQTVVSPGTATFTCEATGNPKPIVTILAKGRKIDKRYKDIGEGMLEVSNVTFQDHGEIECVAKSVIGEDRKKADLKVLVKAHAIIQKKTIKTEEGHDITIRCDVKGNPEPIIAWQKTGSKLPTTASFTDNNKVLEIVNAKLEDTGEYSCKAVNSLATSRSAAQVSITRRLAFEYRQRGTLTANEKSSVALNCLHKNGVPPINTMWTKDGVKINVTKMIRFSANNQVMELRNLQMGDAGSYKCTTKSQISQIQNTVQLIVRLLPATCDRIRKSGQLKSGQYHIYPTADAAKSVQVYCDMDSQPGEGITVISHDSEARTRVTKGYGSAKYKKTIKYKVTHPYIKAIIKNSRKCKQFIKFECHGSYLTTHVYGKYDPSTWWVSAAGQRMKNWGGLDHTKVGCSCSLTNSCAGGHVCNCNKNDMVWREDSGYLDEKEFLPVKELVSGDTDDGKEDAYYTLGKLQCY